MTRQKEIFKTLWNYVIKSSNKLSDHKTAVNIPTQTDLLLPREEMLLPKRDWDEAAFLLPYPKILYLSIFSQIHHLVMKWVKSYKVKTTDKNSLTQIRQKRKTHKQPKKRSVTNVAVGSEIIQENCFTVHNLRKPGLSLRHLLTNSDFDVMAQIVPELMLLNSSCVCGRQKERETEREQQFNI